MKTRLHWMWVLCASVLWRGGMERPVFLTSLEIVNEIKRRYGITLDTEAVRNFISTNHRFKKYPRDTWEREPEPQLTRWLLSDEGRDEFKAYLAILPVIVQECKP